MSSVFDKKAKAIPHREVSKRYVINLIKLIRAEFDRSKYKIILTHSFKQSRFISVQDILRKRQRSCGSLTTVAASLLRSLNIPTKLITGYYKERVEDMCHAWIEVYINNKFVPFEVSLRDYKITKYHKKQGEYVDWSELELD